MSRHKARRAAGAALDGVSNSVLALRFVLLEKPGMNLSQYC